jgi:acyl-CoA synthetase (AMP-forming)/AMP-acid ligase II
MNKYWLKNYPEAVPHDIDVDQYTSLNHLLEESFNKHKDGLFSFCGDHWMRYSELDSLSSALGAYLQSRGLQQGSNIAIMLPNIPQFTVTMAAVLRAGYTCVNVNPLYTVRELEHQLIDSDVNAIIVLENFTTTLIAAIKSTKIKEVIITSINDLMRSDKIENSKDESTNSSNINAIEQLSSIENVFIVRFNQALKQGAQATIVPPKLSLDSVAFLQYTGGTTGLSKGAVLTHRNLVAAILQAEAWFMPAIVRLGDFSRANTIMALPLYHIFALALCLLSIRWGSHITLIPNPRDINLLVHELNRRPFHVLPGVNTLFNALLQHPDIGQIDFSNLCISQAGGMAASEGTARKWQQLTGCPMVEGWGMSETCTIGTNNPVNATEFSGTIGLPLPGIHLVIKDDEDNNLPIGKPGEICIRGPNVMAGYFKKPEETAKVFTRDGYMRTGDIGIMDEQGYTKIVDRKKDMIIVSGFNVYPNELENIISLCPGVVECAVVGIPDTIQGEAIKVFVVKSDPSLTKEDVAKYCRSNFTGYKIPKHIEFKDELPKSNVGKILRRNLRELP